VRLTKEDVAAAIDKFERDSNKSEKIIFDDKLTGFGLRLRRSGRHKWIFQYRTSTHPTQQRRLTLGLVSGISADKARKAADQKYSEAKLGKDPQKQKMEEREKAQQTLATVITDYLEVKKSKLRSNSYAELDRYLHQHWKPLHDKPIAKIDSETLEDRLKQTIKAHGPISAARGRIALSALFVWAMRKGKCASNPVTATDDPAAGARPRERVLSDDELRQVWNAADDHSDYSRIIQLLILTGQRRQEIGSVSWDELDLDTGIWSIPSYRTKNGRAHQIPLPGAALAIIKQVPRRRNIPFLFGRDHGFVSWSMAKAEFNKRCPLKKPWVVHDLRRTCASGLQRLGVRVEVIEKALNHTSGSYRGVAGIYQRDPMTDDVRKALEVWSKHVRHIVTGKKQKESEPVPA
jgi:integrase